MKFKIVHESRGRVRIQVMQKRMTLEQADLLEAYLNHSPAIRQAAVHERTCCAVIQYCGERSALLTFPEPVFLRHTRDCQTGACA